MNAIRSDESIPVTKQRPPLDLEQAQEFWVREADRWDGTSGRFGDAMLDAADLEPGQRVLDVGCGAGSTTIEAARRVAPKGAAVGVDISGPALALARERAVASGLDGVDFIEADAQVHPFEPGAFDAVISRFGTMFFDDPVAAFANLRRALRRGGRLAVVAWQGPFESEWTAVAVKVAIAHFGRPPDLGEPGGPGPFAFADGDRFQERGHGGWLPGRDACGDHEADADGERCRGRRRHGRRDAPKPRSLCRSARGQGGGSDRRPAGCLCSVRSSRGCRDERDCLAADGPQLIPGQAGAGGMRAILASGNWFAAPRVGCM